ncbi:LOW QUALITY PROTEIN: F-actin-capping protein subunit alpha-3 [Cariama cristata]
MTKRARERERKGAKEGCPRPSLATQMGGPMLHRLDPGCGGKRHARGDHTKTVVAGQELHKPEKVSICSLLHQSPPGEFGQVVDLPALAQDDKLVRQEAACVRVCHNKNDFTPIQINGHTVLLTHHNSLEGNRFFNPQDKFSFEFDHLCGATSKPQLHGVMLDEGELWQALHKGLKAYVSCCFPVGNCCVFKKSRGKRQLFVACMEAHQYQLSNHNSLWKSDWTCALTPFTTHVIGIFLLQIHCFRDASLHVTVSKSVSETLNVIDQSQFATDFVKFVKAEDTKFHIAILENIQALSEDIWEKNLWRKLPVTHIFMNWNKLLNPQHLNTNASSIELPSRLLKHTI